MGGGTAGWISALHFLTKNHTFNVKLISSSKIGTIGVGEGSTPFLKNFIDETCDKFDFIKETKAGLKYGIKFNNWNFDNEYYYHTFTNNKNYEKHVDYDFIQHIINEDLDVSTKTLQKKIHGVNYDLLESGRITLGGDDHSYHFSANLIISYLKGKCLDYDRFEYLDAEIKEVSYNDSGYIKKLRLDYDTYIEGDFFVNCLGFSSTKVLSEEYFGIEDWSDYILNDSAFAIQVTNSEGEILDPYTTCTAQDYGWSWKIPQYEKTGYGYVFSSKFIDDEDKLYDDLIKTHNISKENVFKTKTVRSKPYFNRKQIHKNCLSVGLASGFIEPLEATSIHMTLANLKLFQSLIDNLNIVDYTHSQTFNRRIKEEWTNILKFVVFHYFTNNPKNDYWKYYSKIEEDDVFGFYEKYLDEDHSKGMFADVNYRQVSLGLRKKDYSLTFEKEKYVIDNYNNFLNFDSYFNGDISTHNDILKQINLS